jgi:predicted alternative tryptophan synthase beta-subunit
MNVMTQSSTLVLWQDVVKQAEHQCQISLKTELESYLVCLLMRYTNKPEILKQVIATTFLEAISNQHERFVLQSVGDHCLIYAGLFPKTAEKRLVKLSYFVDMGQGAYGKISQYANDVYSLLATQFVALMDILQSIRSDQTLLPLEAYEQWEQVGSQRALRILQSYTKGMPFKK